MTVRSFYDFFSTWPRLSDDDATNIANEAAAFTHHHLLKFHRWMEEKGWIWHHGNYYYRSDDPHQWPPSETCTEKELLNFYWEYTRFEEWLQKEGWKKDKDAYCRSKNPSQYPPDETKTEKELLIVFRYQRKEN